VCGDRREARECAKVHALDVVIQACKTSKSIGRHDVPYISLTLDPATNQTYSSALNSYVTFCDLHHFALEPTVNMLSFYVTFMAAHINPRSVNNYLLGICNLLEEYYPQVQENRKSHLVSWTLHRAKH
jgi:hypothetical protein